MAYKMKEPTFYGSLSSPFKQFGKMLGGIGTTIGGAQALRAGKKELGKARKEYGAAREAYETMDFANPYANMEDTAEDLTINQQAADLAKQQFQQSQANILGSMQGTGGFSAGNIQALVGAGQQAAQQTAADIGRQEQAIQQQQAAERSKIQTYERMGEETRAGKEEARTREMLGMAQARKGEAMGAVADARTAMWGGIADIGGGIGGMVFPGAELAKKTVDPTK